MMGSIISAVSNLADDLITTDEEQAKLDIEDRKIQAEISKGQLEVNKAEASHKSLFVAGWRPHIGWVCGFALSWHFLVQPMLIFLWGVAMTIFSVSALPPLPEFDMETLVTILLGMLGLGGLRTFEKAKGITS